MIKNTSQYAHIIAHLSLIIQALIFDKFSSKLAIKFHVCQTLQLNTNAYLSARTAYTGTTDYTAYLHG
jgi:hypothetical protein